MSHGKDIAYVEERLRAIERDNTFKFGSLALQIKQDFTAMRVRLEALELRMQRLESSLLAESTNGGGVRTP